MSDLLERLDAAIGGPDRRTRDGRRTRKMTPLKVETALLADAKAEIERLNKTLDDHLEGEAAETRRADRERDRARKAEAEIEQLRGLLRAICQPESMKEYKGELRQWVDVGAFLEPGDALLFVTSDTLAAAREAIGQ
jgi:hypothetical protein